jgi:phosphoserine aminotransferase
LKLSDEPAYIHYTSNETIHGVQFHDPPNVGGRLLVSDMSSDILSRPVDVSQFGLIYACAQKNSGIAGVTVVIIRKDLLQRSGDRLPTYLDYRQHAEADSMANTPPTFAVYVAGLVCRWLQEEVGGLESMKRLNEEKAQLLYDTIDESGGFYRGHARPRDRSIMNVVFRLPTDELEKQFLSEAESSGMITLEGHRSLGGIRASIYNAMPLTGVKTLAEFMIEFAARRG